jgi:uncharacterized protein
MLELTLFVDHQCNLRCAYCYNGEKFSRRMPLETAERAVDLVLRKPVRHLDLAFFGGEPLLHLDFLQATTAYAERSLAALPARRPNLRVIVNTNGTRWSSAALDWLAPPRLATVFVSVDGPRDAHDRHRLDARGQGTFDQVLAGLATLREREIAFQVLAVVSVATASRLADTMKLLLGLGARKINLSVNYRDAWTDDACRELARGLHAAGEVWMDHFRSGQALPVDPFHTKILTHLKGGIPCPSRCLLGGHELTVSPTGRIYPCAQMVGEDTRDDLVIGDVDGGVDSERVTALQRAKDRVEHVCTPCGLRDRCQSHCGCRHLALSGSLGEITATLCETESAFIEAADRIAETLFSEQCETFLDYYYRRPWAPAAGSQLTQLRLSRDA